MHAHTEKIFSYAYFLKIQPMKIYATHISRYKYRFWILSELVGECSQIFFAGGEEERNHSESREKGKETREGKQ